MESAAIASSVEVVVNDELRVDQLDEDDLVLSDEELDAAIENTLRKAGYTFNELKAQAAAGQFDSLHASRTWFVVSSLV